MKTGQREEKRRNEKRKNKTVHPLVHTIKPKGVLSGRSSVTELPFFSFIEKTISHLPRSAEQEPHAQQDRKEDQVGQGKQPKILLLPLW